MKRSFKILIGVGLLVFACSPAWTQTGPADQLKQLVADLQKSPDDLTLREKIIKLALTLDPKPAIPEEAERFNARGKAAVKEAQSQKDFAEAAAEFEKAALAAPWLAETYYNLAIVQSKAGDYSKAAQNLKFYLLAAPDSPDAKAAREMMYELEFKAEKLAKAKAEDQRHEEDARVEQRRREQEAAARQAEADRIARAEQERVEALKAKYDGVVWVWSGGDVDSFIYGVGTRLRAYSVSKGTTEAFRKGEIVELDEFLPVDLAKDGTEFTLYSDNGNRWTRNNTGRHPTKWIVSPDGRTITKMFRPYGDESRPWQSQIYRRR